jgi:hypothetical protein
MKDYMNPRAVFDAIEKRKFSLPCREYLSDSSAVTEGM